MSVESVVDYKCWLLFLQVQMLVSYSDMVNLFQLLLVSSGFVLSEKILVYYLQVPIMEISSSGLYYPSHHYWFSPLGF